jgi:hypothetical protein
VLELQQQYESYKTGLQQIASKIGDVEVEAEEHRFVARPHSCLNIKPNGDGRSGALETAQPWHAVSTALNFKEDRETFTAVAAPALLLTASLHRLVLETLEPLPAERKCFRMINGVLVERTVKDVVPALKTNSEGLKKVLEDLMKNYRTKQVEMETWKVGSYSLSIQHCKG